MALTKQDEQDPWRHTQRICFLPKFIGNVDINLPSAPPDGVRPITSAKPREAGPQSPL